MAKKADRGTLTRADMERLGVAEEPVVQMVDRATADLDNRAVNRTELSNLIREVDSQQEAVRNKRQAASTSFQNFDQKANQQYNLLSSVMKSMNEMRMGTVRNML
jgi:methyl-accepting chemotaxis protein